LQNSKWTLPNSKTVVTDRNMVDLTDRLHGCVTPPKLRTV